MEKASQQSSFDLHVVVGLADACELMAASFNYPTLELVDALCTSAYAADAISCLQDIGVDGVSLQDIQEQLKLFEGRAPDELLDTLRKGNSIIYLAPGLGVPVWPYESPFHVMRMNSDAKPALFRTQISMSMEALMRDAGVATQNSRTEPIDSIWNEFSYLSFLYGSLAKALMQEGKDDMEKWQEHIALFSEKHVRNWFDDFMSKSIEEAPKHSFGLEYGVFARIGKQITAKLLDGNLVKDVACMGPEAAH